MYWQKLPQFDENVAATTELENLRAPGISSLLNNSSLLYLCNDINKFKHHLYLILLLVSLFVSLWHMFRNAFCNFV